MKLTYEQAISHPSRVFEKEPINILKHDELTKDEKIKILRHWAYDENEMAVAEEENMPSGEDRGYILDQIHKALIELGASSEGGYSHTKHGN